MNEFLGTVNKEISTYVVIKQTNRFYKTFVYTMVDDENNVLILESDKEIENADGNHYFLIEGTVKEHKEIRREKQTVLIDCDWELVDKVNELMGAFYGYVGDEVQIDNVSAKFRPVYDTEWISNGELTVVAPVSQYRLVFERDCYTFMMPYDSQKKLTFHSIGKYNISGKIIGYTVDRGVKTTFLYPTCIEDKNGAVYSTNVHMRWSR